MTSLFTVFFISSCVIYDCSRLPREAVERLHENEKDCHLWLCWSLFASSLSDGVGRTSFSEGREQTQIQSHEQSTTVKVGETSTSTSVLVGSNVNNCTFRLKRM